jgi:4-amino-4-deoxy-L-arabinose transferase-like glycosyltransferase
VKIRPARNGNLLVSRVLNFRLPSPLPEVLTVPVKESKSRRRNPAPAVEAPAAKPKTLLSPLPFIERYRIALLLALIAIGSIRIVATYHVFSHTWDEPGHIAGGLELLRNHIYQFDQQHPPLTRVVEAIGPWLVGEQPPASRRPGDVWMFQEARRILYGSHKYEQVLFAARLGNLLFFWIGCVVAYLWGKRFSSAAAGVFAAFLFSFFPAVLAHAGLATTDMGCTAMLGAAFLAGAVLLEEPSPRHAVAFGALGGLAILSKFSALVFFPASAALVLACYLAIQRPAKRQIVQNAKTLAPLAAISTAVACLVVWAGYLFSFSHGVIAPELWSGISEVTAHNDSGHWSYLFGTVRHFGFWYFFPVAILVKTPIPLLALAGLGTWLAIRNRGTRLWVSVAYAAGILGVAMLSNINIGLRHILPMYVAIAALGGAALVRLFQGPRRDYAIAVALLVWMAATSLLTHPDYLAYFNIFAGNQPEKIMVDSDLDWGQDVTCLGRRLQALGVHQVTFIPGDACDLKRQPGFEGIAVNQVMSWAMPTVGWNALGVTGLKAMRLGFYDTHPELTLWPDVIPPTERVGKSILLWYFPPNGSVPTLPLGAGQKPPAANK